jgi:chromosome segregation ATPase
MRGHSGADAEEKLNDTFAEIAALRQTLTEEMTLRTEAETQLRVTRKALCELETESRNHESSKATALIGLEEELENRIRETAAAEARASRHEAEQVAVETQLLNLKQDLLQAKREVRRSTAARAKALGTANKAVAFARQSVQARARAESKLREAEDSLANRQETISSLIKALEKEKRRTEEEVSAIARQMTINEKQHYARRSLEEVARSVEGKLSTRLVKKVAKARPLANDS